MIHLDQLDRDRRQDDDDDDGEEFKPEDEGPGGLVGLIANLSGVRVNLIRRHLNYINNF